jgi:type II secretory pathway pseudopilin PulG
MPMILTVTDAARRRPNERGVALVTMLLISLLLLAAGGAVILTTAMSATNSIDSAAETQAYYAAQAGLQSTLNVLRGNVAPNPLIDPSSPSASGNKISFRKAVTASTSNTSSDTNGPRLSRWLTYDSTYTDRVVISQPYSTINGLAYSTSISDPDNSARVVFSTQGAFDNNTAATTASKSYGNGNSRVTVTFNGRASTTINDSGNSTLGSFTISGLGSGNYTIPDGEIFKLTIVQTAPWAATATINCTLSGTISNSSGNLVISFPATSPANTDNLYGTVFTRTASQFNLPNSGAVTSIATTITAPEPQRLIVKVTGYGPRAAKKQMQMLLNRFAFDYTPKAAITMRGSDSGLPMTFAVGNSSQYTYTGYDNAGGTNLPGFAVTSATDYTTATLQVPPTNTQVTGDPALQQVTTSSLSSFLQTADGSRALVDLLRVAAQNQNRYYTTSSPPSDFGASASNGLLTFVDGDVDLPPGGGAGLLVVTGTLTMRGSSDFKGIILVLGTGQLLRDGGGNGTTLGSIVVARFGSTGDFLAPTFNSNGSGTSDVKFDSDWTRRALMTAGPRVMGVSEY